MKEFVPVLKRTKLFAGVGDEDITSMLSCLAADLHRYKKGEYVLREGERLDDILILAEGSLHIQKDDYWGNRSILGHIGIGELFGEAYVAPESGTLLNDVIAVEDSVVFFFDVHSLEGRSFCVRPLVYVSVNKGTDTKGPSLCFPIPLLRCRDKYPKVWYICCRKMQERYKDICRFAEEPKDTGRFRKLQKGGMILHAQTAVCSPCGACGGCLAHRPFDSMEPPGL